MAADLDLSALMSSLSCWEYAGYAGLAIVIIGVVGEGVHDFTTWFSNTWWSTKGGRLSVLVLIAGLAIEGVTQVKANSLSGQIIAFLGEQAATTRERAATLEKEAAELRMSAANLEKRVGPRIIDRDLFLSALDDGPKREFEIQYGAEDQDSWMLSIQLRALLEKAGWRFISVTPLPITSIITQSVIVPMTVRLQVRSISAEETQAMLSLSLGKTAEPKTPYTVVGAALIRGLGRGVVGGADPSLADRIHDGGGLGVAEVS